MQNKPCRQEGCQITTEVFGEANAPEIRCFYPDANWEPATLDQTIECEACPMLSIHCGHLVDVRISRSKNSKISFRLHGTYNRPTGNDELYMTLQVSRDPNCPYSLLLRYPGYLCGAFNRNGMTLDITIPAGHCFKSFAINARSINSSVDLISSTRLRLSAHEDISAKLISPQVMATARTGMCLTFTAAKQSTVVDISCDGYIELTLLGYDAYEVVCPSSGHLVGRKYRLSLFPVTFRGKVISKTGEAMIV